MTAAVAFVLRKPNLERGVPLYLVYCVRQLGCHAKALSWRGYLVLLTETDRSGIKTIRELRLNLMINSVQTTAYYLH